MLSPFFSLFSIPAIAWTAVAGEHRLTEFLRSGPEPKVQLRKVKEAIHHPLYRSDGFDYDITILELVDPFIFDNLVQPICLPDEDEDFTGQVATAAGFGKTDLGKSRT
ncbi:unnamed protein product [Protopolystoma xenopodis]|uniref:Peptidase S1 domain-containing protein n=1 Tax=Protopolystoma xenopodis TaxID=117903 RepID=A0A3S5AP38_9PLAT|nr:unnamed protein product [Protopolystoma xenopodis]